MIHELVIVMVGDGINDAPTLKQASTGDTMGSGTYVALETADVAIPCNRCTAEIQLTLAKIGKTRRNITAAWGLKAHFPVTLTQGMTGLWIAILAAGCATAQMTLNVLRRLLLPPERER